LSSDESPPSAEADANPLRFTGQYLDSDSELYYLRAREYDSETGRFLEVDPLEAVVGEPSAGVYVYVDDRPTVEVDPSGRIHCTARGFLRWRAVDSQREILEVHYGVDCNKEFWGCGIGWNGYRDADTYMALLNGDDTSCHRGHNKCWGKSKWYTEYRGKRHEYHQYFVFVTARIRQHFFGYATQRHHSFKQWM
jgi:RHS repeat-associated protein